MPSNQTTNYGLSQWDATDPVLRADFNADNAKIDTVLGSVSAAVAGKLGYSEIIMQDRPTGTAASTGYSFPALNWEEWEYVCILVGYPADVEDIPLAFRLWSKGTSRLEVTPLATPGYLIVFLPRHNGSKPAEGFVISDRLYPFYNGPAYQEFRQMDFDTKNKISIALPAITMFGGK